MRRLTLYTDVWQGVAWRVHNRSTGSAFWRNCMPRKELSSLITKLKDEMERLREDQRGSRDQIESLIDDLQTHVETGKPQNWPAEMATRVSEEIERFETEHPQITGILNNIMVTLGNVGI